MSKPPAPGSDRCGIWNRLVHLVGWPLGAETYWLCQACIDAIVMVWLQEHKTLIARNRKRRTERDEGLEEDGVL